MFDLLKILITFILTGCVGVFISYKVQKKQSHNNIIIKKAEKKISELKDTRDIFEDLSSDRIYRSRITISSLKEGEISEKDRESYQLSVANWNKKLNTLFFELNSQNIYYIAIEIERDVQKYFAMAHKEIKKEINKKTIPTGADLNFATDCINTAYKNAKNISENITDIAEKRWDDIKNADSVPLSEFNLDKASAFTLIAALFHPTPHKLRISRSRFDR